MVPQEPVIGVAIQVDADADDGHAFRFHSFAHADQRRHFLHAWRAPGRPKIKHYNLAMELAQGDLAISVLDGEIGCVGAYQGRTGAAVAAEQKKNHYGNRGKKPSHTDIITTSAHGEARNCAA